MSPRSSAPRAPTGAFVLWLAPDAEPGQIAGEVEYVPTAERRRFRSAEELVAFLESASARARRRVSRGPGPPAKPS